MSSAAGAPPVPFNFDMTHSLPPLPPPGPAQRSLPPLPPKIPLDGVGATQVQQHQAFPPRSSSHQASHQASYQAPQQAPVAAAAHNFSRKPFIPRKPPPSNSSSVGTSTRGFPVHSYSGSVGDNQAAAQGSLRPQQYHHVPRKSSGTVDSAALAAARAGNMTPTSSDGQSTPSRELETPEPSLRDSSMTIPPTQTLPIRVEHIRQASDAVPPSQAAEIASVTEASVPDEPAVLDEEEQPAELYPALQYAHQPYVPPSVPPKEKARVSPVSAESRGPTPPHLRVPTDGDDSSVPQRPRSALTVGSGSDGSHGRNSLPRLGIGSSASPVNGTPSPRLSARGFSANRHSPDHRPMSYVDLLSHVPYHQQTAPAPQLDNSFLRRAVGSNASLLKTSQTLEMYRANLKKTTEPEVQYEFAIFMIQTAMELPPDEPTGQGQPGQLSRSELIREARHVLQKLADRSYPFAQYYLADGFSSGLFNKGKPDYDRAFPLFLAASKHMHAESGFRAALCYEFGWGCRKDYLKAQQFYRASAARGHPGAACRLGVALIEGLLGLSGTREERREGIKWLKRAAENADGQYNSAPYELGKLHEHGFGDEIFKDEVYAAQLFTQSADLGHPEANLVMGKAYEHGLLKCPKDAALSIHFYNGAAQAGLPEAMMALCAWYLFGAEPVLPKDEGEAFEWAKRAADLGYAKAQYAVGYFKEIGIGCRQDTLDANVWYVKAADQGEERAKQRLAVIRDAASGGSGSGNGGDKQKSKKGLLGKLGL